MKSKTVVDDIYVLKGIAIIGLMIWHTYNTALPLINSSFSKFIWSILAIYAMPSFMFASGFLYGFSRLEISSFSEYASLITKKSKRLLVPYFSVWGIYIAAEFTAEFASGFTTLNYSVDRDFWKYILFYPIKGTALHLWFLYHLLFVFLFFPILKKLFRNSFVLFLFIFSLWLIPIPNFSYFNHEIFRRVLLLFYLGYLYSHFKFEKINAYSRYICVVMLGLLIIFSVQKGSITNSLNTFMDDYLIHKLFFALIIIGTLFYYYLSVVIANYRTPFYYMLKCLGTYSVSIYLFHHIALGIVRHFFISGLHVSKNLYPFISIIVFLSGMVLPVLFTKYIISKFKFLPPLLLGAEKVPQCKGWYKK